MNQNHVINTRCEAVNSSIDILNDECVAIKESLTTVYLRGMQKKKKKKRCRSCLNSLAREHYIVPLFYCIIAGTEW